MKIYNLRKYLLLLIVGGLLLSGCGNEKNSNTPQSSMSQETKTTTSPSNSLKSLTPVGNTKLAEILPETFAGEKRLKLKEGTFYEDISAANASYGAGLESGKRATNNWDGVLATVTIWDCAGETGANQSKSFRMILNGPEEQTEGDNLRKLITIEGEKGYEVIDKSNFAIHSVTLLVNERYLIFVKSHEQEPSELIEFIKQSEIIEKLKVL